MSTSAKQWVHEARFYGIFTLGTAVFGAVYEYFSHDVWSYFMAYAFLIPMLAGLIPSLFLSGSKVRRPAAITLTLYKSGIVCLTIGSLFLGVLEIYGTTNQLVWIYFIAGMIILALSAISLIFRPKSSLPEKPEVF